MGMASSSGYEIRRASHAGSWYTDDETELNTQLSSWIEEANQDKESNALKPVKAIIGPHAGFAYSGPTAAFAYKNIDPTLYSRVFILGPSHKVYLDCCAISGATLQETPVGNLKVDDLIVQELMATGKFKRMTQKIEEDEHSIEMHLPYIAKLFQGKDITVIPIMVGAIDDTSERKYGTLLAPYLNDPENLFIISSDFCHWGKRFQYQPYDSSSGLEIHSYIRQLDHEGMEHIEQKDCIGFSKYLKTKENTICGRHPIAVLLHAVNTCEPSKEFNIKFVKYAQSSPCQTKHDSSVSYASAIVEETTS